MNNDFKTNRQNALFHSLLKELWLCGVSSFNSYNELRNYYKNIAGLIEYKKVIDFTDIEKKLIYNAFKKIPLKNDLKNKIFNLLKNQLEVHKSWSEAKIDDAKLAIKTLIDDCITLGADASSEKIKNIINELNKGV